MYTYQDTLQISTDEAYALDNLVQHLKERGIASINIFPKENHVKLLGYFGQHRIEAASTSMPGAVEKYDQEIKKIIKIGTASAA